MGDTLPNGRPAEDWELAAIEYRRPPDVPSRPVSDLPVLP